ncbi:hypothetical protein N9D10_00520 [bacterium]|nr:hypothetical protein [bacterium]
MAPRSAQVLCKRALAKRQNRPLYLPMRGAGQPFFTDIGGFFCCLFLIWQKPCKFRSIMACFPMPNRVCLLINIITGRYKS